MNSMIFTKTPLKKKKPVIHGTNNMGKYYNNEKVAIKNYINTSIAERIDKNMSNLLVPTNLSDKNLVKFINPILNVEDANFINTDFNSSMVDNISVNDILALTNPTVTNPIQMNLTNKNIDDTIEDNKLDVQMNIETDKNLNTFVNNVYTTETLTITRPLPPNVVKMNIEIDKKYFNSFVTSLNIHEHTNNGFHINFDEEQEIFKKINSKKSIIDEILQNLRLTKLTIENVYQEKYGDVNASGIGDFLRGSYFLLQFCEQFGFSYSINMLNHPISQFLQIYQHEESSIYSNISIFRTRNFKPVLLEDGILTNTYNYKINICFLYFLYFHICKIHAKSVINDFKKNDKKIYAYIISYPNTPIREKHKLYMQQLLKPTTEFLSIINNTLDDLGLVQKEFVVIHIRYGDKFLLNNEENVDLEHIKIIDKTIELLDPEQPILLISDNTIIKDLIVKKYPFIKTHFNEITHTGEGVEIDDDKLKNTMLDFYLFSFAEKIFAFSVYCHGTGFSKWIAETYSIPYDCRFLP